VAGREQDGAQPDPRPITRWTRIVRERLSGGEGASLYMELFGAQQVRLVPEIAVPVLSHKALRGRHLQGPPTTQAVLGQP
jgi:hypothetical protein